MDNLLEFGSNVNIDFIAICDFKTNNHSYEKDEIVISLNDVYATLYYNARTTNNVSRYTELYYSDYTLAGININNVPLTQQFYDLFSNEKLSNIQITRKKSYPVFGNTIYILDKNVIEDTIKVKDIEEYTINKNEGGYYIQSEEFNDGEEYIISYNILCDGHSFNLYSANVDIPYLKMQLRFLGNEDKQDTNGYLIIDKSALIYQPNIEFTSNHVASCNLRCVVVDPKDNPPKLVVIDDVL